MQICLLVITFDQHRVVKAGIKTTKNQRKPKKMRGQMGQKRKLFPSYKRHKNRISCKSADQKIQPIYAFHLLEPLNSIPNKLEQCSEQD